MDSSVAPDGLSMRRLPRGRVVRTATAPRYAAIHLAFTSASGTSRAVEAGRHAVQRVLESRPLAARLDWTDEGVSVIIEVERGPAPAVAQRFADGVLAHLGRVAPDVIVSQGIGPVAADADSIERSRRRAEITARVGDLLVGPGSAASHDELGAYPALYEAVNADATRSAFADLVERYLGAAMRYERAFGLPFLDTMAAYFAQHGNVAATARALGLNRQSLLYRLERFETLSGVDLGSPTDRFALELALHCVPMRQARAPWMMGPDWQDVCAEAT